MFDFVTAVYFVVSVAAYGYVGVAVGNAAVKGGTSLPEAVFHGAIWPYSIWQLISDRYDI